MKKSILPTAVMLLFSVLVMITFWITHEAMAQNVKLPEPKYEGTVSVEKALMERRSARSYRDGSLTLGEISQILWAAQGITEPKKGMRTAPSARSLYLLETYVLPENVTGLPMGMYKYQPKGHELVRVAEGNKKADLFKAAGQDSIKNAPAVIVFTGNSERATNPNWIYYEAGHAAQNVYLQAVSLNLGTVAMAGFKPDEVKKALNLPEKEHPLYIMPIGKK